MGVGLIVLILLAVTLFGPARGIFGPSHTPTFTETVTSSAISTASSTPTATTTPTITETPSPAVLILIAIPQQNVNCREGNGSAFEIADTLMEGEEYSPTGRGYDNMWVRFVGPTFQQVCWAAIGNLVLEINEVLTAIEDIPESLLPFVNYPATPTPSPTITFTPEGDEPFTPQCNDGIDNDSDRAIDFPRDKNCASVNDNDESK
jgi:hypothetical protein